MPIADRPDQTADDGVAIGEKPPRVALVPVVPSAQWRRAIFVTHLIANAEQLPQTRHMRRATAANAQTAYRPQVQGASIRTRQII